MYSFIQQKNEYESFEFSLFNELFLVLREACKTQIQNYRRHLLWHGIDICAELFHRRLDNVRLTARSIFRQSRQFLIAWLAFVVEKMHFNNVDFASGLCDGRCYDISEIPVDPYLFDKSAIGPQMPPPTRLRLSKKRSTMTRFGEGLLEPIPVGKYEKTAKKPFKEGKLSSLDVVLEERRKQFDEYKEMKYVKLLLELLVDDKRYAQFEKALTSCMDILTHRFENNVPFRRTDQTIADKSIEASEEISKLTLQFLDKLDDDVHSRLLASVKRQIVGLVKNNENERVVVRVGTDS